MGYDLRTKRGYDFYAVTSSVQKAIRRNRPDIAGYFALELFHSGFDNYLWKRLLTISAEDCFGAITREVSALRDAYLFVNKGKKEKKGRIFISKAVLLLCAAVKSRDADVLQCVIYDKEKIARADIEAFIREWEESDKKDIPEYAWDCHTRKGKAMGKTKEDFFKEEQAGLQPEQRTLFPGLI